MKLKKIIPAVIFCFCLLYCQRLQAQHDIIFCGERIPVGNNMVASTLMNVIKKQVPNINMPALRKRAAQYFPYVEQYLQGRGLPEDLKYLAIVESGFANLTSGAGARGMWQLMPLTARDAGLTVSESTDDRDNFQKSTEAACKVLTDYYLRIRNQYKLSSWVLTAAAYNFGIGNISKAIRNQGNDYFSMNLNAETAVYVYKIIAVKELFEYPELYMKDFGYNIFSALTPPVIDLNNSAIDSSAFKSMIVNVNTKDGEHPDSVSSNIQLTNVSKKQNIIYIAANIKGKYKNFSDGELVSIELQEDLTVNGIFNRKGNKIKGRGWLIDDRILVDLGYEDHAVTLIKDSKKGIDIAQLKNDQPILLKVVTDEN